MTNPLRQMHPLNLRRCLLPLALLASWIATGLYVVRGNEAAVVRVFGRVQRDATGQVVTRPSGLYVTAPWPFAQVDVVNLNEIRTLPVGGNEAIPDGGGGFLQLADGTVRTQYVSGDKNILHVTLNVHYRVAPQAVEQWLYGSAQPERRLRDLAESVLADVVIRCGVDFLHTLGHSEVRAAVLKQLRHGAQQTGLGVEIDDVTLVGIAPPVRVKSDFVEVMNARAERETQINHALAYAEQREAETRAAEQTTRDFAEQYRRQWLERAKAEAGVVQALEDAFAAVGADSSTARSQYLERLRLSVRQEVLQKARRTVIAPDNPQGALIYAPTSEPVSPAKP